jgi:putative transposase
MLNRGIGRSDVFHKGDDFAAFVKLKREAHEKVPMRLAGFWFMSNHWHLVVRPLQDGELFRFTGWLTLTHTQLACPPPLKREWARLPGPL